MLNLFMALPADRVGKGVMFFGCQYSMFIRTSICLFVWTDLLPCYRDISWTAWAILMKLTWNMH